MFDWIVIDLGSIMKGHCQLSLLRGFLKIEKKLIGIIKLT